MSKKVVLDADREWIYRDFMKEKLRVRERYWHYISNTSKGGTTTLPPIFWNEASSSSSKSSTILLPDGICWRIYLPLWTSIAEQQREEEEEEDNAQSRSHLVLCESAVELMDYRSMSPVRELPDGTRQAESPAPQERSKIQKLIQGRKIIPFCDLSVREFDCDEWYMMEYEKMDVEERSKHALLRTGGILRQFFPEAKILIVTANDQFICQFPSEEEAKLVHINDLFHELAWNNTEAMQELMQRCEDNHIQRNVVNKATNSISDSQEHLSDEKIRTGLKNNTLVKGRLDISKENSKEAYVSVSTGGTYFIDGTRGHFNRSIHYDIVVIEPLPESEWGRPMGRRRLVHHRDDDDKNENQPVEIDSSPAVPSARVVAITEPSRRQFVATMVDMPMNDENVCLVIPMDIRIPKIRIKTNAWRKFVGNRLLVQIDAWEVGSNYPTGHCMEILGAIADLETEISCLLRENQLNLEPFSASALACLPPDGNDWKIPSKEIENRLDLRSSHRIFSVDPPGCQDIDDTMHARVLPNGDLEIGVHIADVTHFLQHKSPLDVQAQARGTTFYLVDRRFDMLPSLLSSDLCSLHGSTDRLAVSTIWTMSKDYKEIKSFWYGRTVIHNCQAMTYDQAHNIIHGNPPEDDKYATPPPLTAGSRVNPQSIGGLKHDLTILTNLARKLRKDREEIGGAVDLSSGDQGNELKFTLDENNNPVKVTPKKQQEIHSTIAELMILANTWVAKTIYEKFPNTALLRSHRSVDEDRFGDLKEALKAGKISFDGSTNMALASSLKKAENDSKSKSLMSLFQSLATRAMSEALYVCTGQVTEAGLSHYGLGLEKYTHFTSPIRRYADVVVHRQLLEEVTKDARTSSNAISRQTLTSLPSSKVISIEGGEGLVDTSRQDNEVSDPPSDDVPGLVESNDSAGSLKDQPMQVVVGDELYKTNEVVQLCDGVNRQNRMAKFSSFECQNLFLSIFFKDNTEMTQAIVTSLRSNGFWVYVPRFDFRGPVYLTDMTGALQIDPTLLNLDPLAGQEPSRGFASSGCARMFMSGKCALVRSPEEHLEVAIPEVQSPYVVNVLDVVTVKICCDEWDARARVPQPRLHLVRASKRNQKAVDRQKETLQKGEATGRTVVLDDEAGVVESTMKRGITLAMTLDSDLLGLQTPPVLDHEPLRIKSRQQKDQGRGVPTMPGRIVFGDFRNPDTRAAQQEASISEASEAAKLRRSQAVATSKRNNEYDSTRRIEKDVTARMQRLAAGKRNTRKAKGK